MIRVSAIQLKMDDAALQDIVRQLDSCGDLTRHANKALTAGAAIIAERAAQLAPVRTGRLKKSIATGRHRNAHGRISVEVGAFYTDAPHAHLVELGHAGPKPARAHPFLEPAVEQVEDEVVSTMLKILKEAL